MASFENPFAAQNPLNSLGARTNTNSISNEELANKLIGMMAKSYPKKASAEDAKGMIRGDDITVEMAEEGTGTPIKGLWDLSTEIIRGNYGNGAERKQKLEAEGYNYHQVQDFVNKRIYGTLKDSDYDRDYFTGESSTSSVVDTPAASDPDSVKAPNFSDANENIDENLLDAVRNYLSTEEGKLYTMAQKLQGHIPKSTRPASAPASGDIDIETILSLGLDPNDYL